MQEKKETKEVKKEVREVKRTPEQEQKLKLQREKNELLLKKNASINIDDLMNDSTTDREYARKFKKVFSVVRKGLVVIKAKKVSGEYNNETAYNETFALFEKAQEL